MIAVLYYRDAPQARAQGPQGSSAAPGQGQQGQGQSQGPFNPYLQGPAGGGGGGGPGGGGASHVSQVHHYL